MQLLAKWVADRENHEAMKSGKEFTEIELWSEATNTVTSTLRTRWNRTTRLPSLVDC